MFNQQDGDKIAAIVVNYKSAKSVSVFAQKLSYAGIFCVVVNNSPEETIRFANVINNSCNLGFSAAANIGINIALQNKVNQVILINPDISIRINDLKRLAKENIGISSPILTFIRKGHQVFDFGGKVNWLTGRTTHIETKSTHTKYNYGHINYVSGACVVINSTVLQKVGLLDERFFMYLEDVDYCLRAQQAGFSVEVNTNIIAHHKIEEHRAYQDTNKIKLNLQSNLKFINKWVSWVFKPIAYSYLFIVLAKICLNYVFSRF